MLASLSFAKFTYCNHNECKNSTSIDFGQDFEWVVYYVPWKKQNTSPMQGLLSLAPCRPQLRLVWTYQAKSWDFDTNRRLCAEKPLWMPVFLIQLVLVVLWCDPLPSVRTSGLSVTGKQRMGQDLPLLSASAGWSGWRNHGLCSMWSAGTKWHQWKN